MPEKKVDTNAITLLFGRLKERAGLLQKRVSPSTLRDSFAVRYLQAGGEPDVLQRVLGLTNPSSVNRYLFWVNKS